MRLSLRVGRFKPKVPELLLSVLFPGAAPMEGGGCREAVVVNVVGVVANGNVSVLVKS